MRAGRGPGKGRNVPNWLWPEGAWSRHHNTDHATDHTIQPLSGLETHIHHRWVRVGGLERGSLSPSDCDLRGGFPSQCHCSTTSTPTQPLSGLETQGLRRWVHGNFPVHTSTSSSCFIQLQLLAHLTFSPGNVLSSYYSSPHFFGPLLLLHTLC